MGARRVPRVIFMYADGREVACESLAGTSVLDCALDGGVTGLGGQCGGAATCGTCHCHVDAAFVVAVGPATGDEADLLPYLDDVGEGSRLACQIRLTEALDGLRVHVPPPG